MCKLQFQIVTVLIQVSERTWPDTTELGNHVSDGRKQVIQAAEQAERGGNVKVVGLNVGKSSLSENALNESYRPGSSYFDKISEESDGP